MKKILFAGVAALALASCSNDEMVMEKNDATKINFAVATQGNSRAVDVFCNNNKPGAFNVWATLTDGGTTQDYILGDLIQANGTKWENMSGNRYWPNSGALNFYGLVNHGTGYDKDARTVAFTVADEVKDQLDLLYAVNADGLSKSETATAMEAVKMYFHHALSQVVFKARNNSKNLYVEIDSVGIANLYNAGTYTLPTTTTTLNYEHPAGEAIKVGEDTKLANTGDWNWAEGAAQTTAYKVNTWNQIVTNDNTVVDLTENAKAASGDNTPFEKAMLLLPQANEPLFVYETVEKTREVEVDGVKGTETYYENEVTKTNENGTFFTVKCKVYNIADTEKGYQADKDVCIWNGDEKGNVIVPVKIDWKEGYKYIYTFVFGDGNGGFTPDPDDPKPVLIPITFDVAVDEFKPVQGNDVDLQF